MRRAFDLTFSIWAALFLLFLLTGGGYLGLLLFVSGNSRFRLVQFVTLLPRDRQVGGRVRLCRGR
jgi:hypothetical protein